MGAWRTTILTLLALLSWPATVMALTPDDFADTIRRADRLAQLNALIIAHEGRPIVGRRFRGPDLDSPVNIKSASKSVISALVGIAIERELIEGVDEIAVSKLGSFVSPDADPKVRGVTIGNLLSMQSGLERTSGAYYGRWTSSPNWVRYALSRPFVDDPGGRMLYSTGNTHILSAVLTRAGKRSTLDLAREWLGEPLDIRIPAWPRDPQGIYFGGNDMALSPRALLRFGELYRNDGTVDGRRVLSSAWIRASWTPRTTSPFSGDDYGYGWFIAQSEGHAVYYARGYGGQLLYVLPSLALTVVITSDPTAPARTGGYFSDIESLLGDSIVPAVLKAQAR